MHLRQGQAMMGAAVTLSLVAVLVIAFLLQHMDSRKKAVLGAMRIVAMEQVRSQLSNMFTDTNYGRDLLFAKNKLLAPLLKNPKLQLNFKDEEGLIPALDGTTWFGQDQNLYFPSLLPCEAKLNCPLTSKVLMTFQSVNGTSRIEFRIQFSTKDPKSTGAINPQKKWNQLEMTYAVGDLGLRFVDDKVFCDEGFVLARLSFPPFSIGCEAL